MKKFKNKYRVPSARLQNWDYGAASLYFITICTQNRVCYFGDVRDGHMQLSETGKIVESEWEKTFEIRKDMNVWQGEYVVMPNHFHAIIGIGENQYNTVRGDANTNTTPKNQFGPQSKNLASIIRDFKSSVTMGARNIVPEFQWQSRFYDHIIRNDNGHNRISEYIINNPANWNNDKFYSK